MSDGEGVLYANVLPRRDETEIGIWCDGCATSLCLRELAQFGAPAAKPSELKLHLLERIEDARDRVHSRIDAPQ